VFHALIPFINTAGFLIPQLFTANTVERAPVKKWFPVNLGFFLERLPVMLFAPSAYFLATRQPVLAMAAFFLLYAWYSFGAGLIIVGWQDMIAKIIPMEIRGRFFGITNFIGGVSGILGAVAVTAVLEKFVFPIGYAISFAAAALLIFLSWISLALTAEPAIPSSKPPVSQKAYFRSLPEILRKDHNFVNYLAAVMLFMLSGMASGFLAVYASQKWSLPDAQAGGFIIAMQTGTALTNLFFGFLADRKGHKMSLEIAYLVGVLSLALAVIAPSPWWFYPIFFLRGTVSAGGYISACPSYTSSPARKPPPPTSGWPIPSRVVGTLAPLFGGCWRGRRATRGCLSSPQSPTRPACSSPLPGQRAAGAQYSMI
jgi:MFS family permease